MLETLVFIFVNLVSLFVVFVVVILSLFLQSYGMFL